MKSTRLSAVNWFSTVRWLMLGACALAAPALMAQVQGGVSVTTQFKTKSNATLSSRTSQKVQKTPVVEVALTTAELLIAQRVEVGVVQCELGQFVELVADPKVPGYFDVSGKKFRFRMAPVVTSTGAIRLEDVHAGAVWLQLSNKSMLMSQKLGSRLADACITPAQAVVAQAMEKTPPPSLLDSPVVAGQLPMSPKVALSDHTAQ